MISCRARQACGAPSFSRLDATTQGRGLAIGLDVLPDTDSVLTAGQDHAVHGTLVDI